MNNKHAIPIMQGFALICFLFAIFAGMTEKPFLFFSWLTLALMTALKIMFTVEGQRIEEAIKGLK